MIRLHDAPSACCDRHTTIASTPQMSHVPRCGRRRAAQRVAHVGDRVGDADQAREDAEHRASSIIGAAWRHAPDTYAAVSDRFPSPAARGVGSPSRWCSAVPDPWADRGRLPTAGAAASARDGRSRCSRCCWCTAARSFRSTASSTSSGRAPGPQHARNAVHVVASRLRGALGEGVVLSEGGGYARALRPGRSTPSASRTLFRRGRAELARGEPREAAATLRQALALWRGPALADVAEERFAQPEIARLEDLRLACLGDRVDADLACGRHAEVAGELEALVREHPLRERLRGQLMLALYRAGRQADALAAYRDAPTGRSSTGSASSRRRTCARWSRRSSATTSPSPPSRRVRGAALAPDMRRWVTCVCSPADRRRRASTPSPCARCSSASTTRPARSARATAAASSSCATTRCVAVLGIPTAHEDDALRALRAAAELRGRPRRCRSACARAPASAPARSSPRRPARGGRRDRRGGRRGRAAGPRRPRAARSGSPTRPGRSCVTRRAPPQLADGGFRLRSSTPARPRSAAGSTGR